MSLSPHTLEALRKRIRASVRGRVPRADVDDVIQEALLRVYRGLPSLKNPAALHGWVTSVIHGTVVDFHRRRPVLAAVVDTAQAEEEVSALVHLEPFVLPFLAMVREPYRSAVELTDVQGLTQAEAARRLRLAPATMKSRVQRGRQQLRAIIEECCAISFDSKGTVLDLGPRPLPTKARRRPLSARRV